jgi:hypothetical protein
VTVVVVGKVVVVTSIILADMSLKLDFIVVVVVEVVDVLFTTDTNSPPILNL